MGHDYGSRLEFFDGYRKIDDDNVNSHKRVMFAVLSQWRSSLMFIPFDNDPYPLGKQVCSHPD